MARLEASLGVRSCFLFQLTGHFYNACSAPCRSAVADLRQLGHEIGLHFSEHPYIAGWKGGLPPGHLEDLVDREARLFGQVHGLRVRVVSFHRPSPAVLNLSLTRYLNAYETPFFGRMKYLSDSTMRWREGCACRHARPAVHPRLQLLVHPEWWQPVPQDRGARRKALLASARSRLQREWAAEIEGAPVPRPLARGLGPRETPL